MSSKVASVKSFFDDTQKYLQHNPIIALRQELIVNALGNIQDKNIIDAGCGNGRISASFAKHNRLTLADISANMLEEAKHVLEAINAKAEAFICGDIEQLSFEQKFDVVLLVGVLAHVNDPKQLIAKYAELLNQNGQLIIQYTNASHWLAKLNAKRKKLKEQSTYQYSINHTCAKDVLRWATEGKLTSEKKFTYFPVSPFFSLCPKAWRLTFIRFFTKFPVTRLAGSEHLLVFTKK
jgi:2-polyprenyl-3-methyl-5-hydroxy-6-metoxy-1,4-benzoquinol methylase